MNALLAISAVGLLALFSELFNFKKLLPYIAPLGILVALAALFAEWNVEQVYYGMMHADKLSQSFVSVLLFTALVWFVLLKGNRLSDNVITDHYAIYLFAIAGGIAMVSYSNFTMLFVGLEVLSISMYIMASSNKQNLLSNEAGFKYLLMGAFATCFLLFGITLLYGATGTFDLERIADYVLMYSENLPGIFYAGLFFVLAGLLFKVSAVPFHWWAPDVYEGSPTIVTAFMSTIVKTAAFGAFYRLFSTCFVEISESWSTTIQLVIGLTIISGNVLALVQNRLKRILAYSGVAHAGYMLLAIVSVNQHSAEALALYALAYSVATLLIFAVFHTIENQGIELTVAGLKGFGRQNPFIAVVSILALFSLAGIPPTAGFFAKYYIFTAAIQSGHVWLVVLAVMGSLISVFYYLRLLIVLFEKETTASSVPMHLPSNVRLVILASAVVLLVLGLAPGLLIDLF